MRVEIEMRQIFCATCGVPYCVPDWLFRNYTKEDEGIHRPDGHSTFYTYKEQKRPNQRR
jgi:hypothetical protein